MLGVTIFFLLGVFAVCAVCTFCISSAGEYSGAKGAVIAALSFWAGLTSLLQLLSLEYSDPLRFLPFNALVVAILISIIFIPMLLFRRFDWKRGRLVAGYVGSVVATAIYAPLALALGCAMGLDCV